MERPADIDAAIRLMAQACRHIDGRTPETLDAEIVDDLVSALQALTLSIDRHRPDVRARGYHAVLDEFEITRRSRAKLAAFVEMQKQQKGT